MRKSPATIKAIDFFCGAGGMTRGLLDAGINVLGGVDIDPRLRATYETNNAPSQFVCKDIRKIEVAAFRQELGIQTGDPVLYAACTPCQPFSSLNRAVRQDERKDLLLAFGEIVMASPPDFIIVENVPGLHHAYGRDIQREFLKQIRSVGFESVFTECLDAADYRVPQVRKRFILLASRRGKLAKPARARRRVTVREAIKRFPRIKHGHSSSEFHNHIARRLMDHHLVIVHAVPRNGGSRADIADESILLKCHQEKPRVHKDVFGRMAWNLPSPTLTARCTDVYCGRFVHPSQNRGISLREAAALQTFPDDYEFHGSFFHIASQIGNAVPVQFARRLGEAIVRSLRYPAQ